MCCFAQPVTAVGRTQIFARLSGRGTQYLVYQMQYDSPTRNAMILPIPTVVKAADDAVQFVNMNKYDRFFRDLRAAFPEPTPPSFNSKTNARAGSDTGAAPLLVHQVGNFTASFVPTQQDFSRLDPQFVISADTWAKIPKYQDYGFVVFQLEQLRGEPHPMAFEFPTREPDQLFFPTVHIHDGEVHEREDFDHTLYCQHAAFDNVVGKYTRRSDAATGLTRSKTTGGDTVDVQRAAGVVNENLLIHRKNLQGRLVNQDVLIAAKGDPLRLTRSPYWLGAPLLGIALAAWPVGWLIRRRMRLAAGDKFAGEKAAEETASAPTSTERPPA